MKSAIQKDHATDARALVLAGLDVDSTCDESISVEGYKIQRRSTLLEWAAAYGALECTKVRDVTSPRLHPVIPDGSTFLRFSFCMPAQQ